MINLTTFESRQVGVDQMRIAERVNHDNDVEIVLLSAESEASLRRTHSRYFGESTVRAFSAAF
ncbi:MAG: hypothetical protein D4R92_02220 [Actinobacteria bacterium]|nr:MAG: hypothetical protein D4R92_02220 [Actinomycetota bacterium]